MVRLAPAILTCCLVLSAAGGASAQGAADSLVSAEERAWIEQHEPIRVAFDGYFPPYSFHDDAEEIAGLAMDTFALLCERLDIEFEVATPREWGDIYDAALAREIDVVATMVQRPEREAHFAFTRPYIFKSLVIVTRDDDDRIGQRENIAGKTVALVQSYQWVSRLLEEYPTLTPQYHDTLVDALNAVSTGQADASITHLGAGHFVRSRYHMPNLRFAAVYDADSSNERIAVRADWPILATVLDRGLANIRASERIEIERRWLPVPPGLHRSARIPLTVAERAWIEEHPVIRVGVDPEFHPFEFVDEDGRHRGMAADYLALLGPRLGLNFEVVPDVSWREAVELAEGGEIDLLASVGWTRERDQYLTYSQPYAEYHRVIVTRLDMPFLRGISDLQNLRVAAQTNSSHEGYLRENSTLETIGCPTLEACVRAVSAGEVDALVGNVASLSHWIRQLNLTNLKVAGAVSDEIHTLHMASRSDWPVLAGLLQKGLNSVTTEERQAIANRWVVVGYEPAVDRRSMWRVLAVSSIAVLLLLVWALSIIREKARVQSARDEALAAEAGLRAANDELDTLRRGLEKLVTERTTELVETERAFHEAQRMEALGTLVGGVAHDFNNILQGMIGSIFLVEHELQDEAQATQLRRAADLGYRAADLIAQLLAVARKGSGRKVPVDLCRLIGELDPILRTTLPAAVQFERTGLTDGLVVYGNDSLLQQVVLNLVNNARDAVEARDDARVRLTLRRAGPDDNTPSGLGGAAFAVVEVEDNGRGIPEDVAKRIFDPFFTTKPRGKGTGLGLAMAFGAVQEHGGTIEVDSELGRGTTFRVYLPTVQEALQTTVDQTPELRPGSGETVLFADSERAVLANHVAVAELLGYRALTATNGVEALALLSQRVEEIDLVVLDAVMPEMDGVAAYHIIRERWPTLPVLFLTARVAEGGLRVPMRTNAGSTLTKPCSPQQLSAAIRGALSGADTAGGA